MMGEPQHLLQLLNVEPGLVVTRANREAIPHSHLWEVPVVQASHNHACLTQPPAKQRTPGLVAYGPRTTCKTCPRMHAVDQDATPEAYTVANSSCCRVPARRCHMQAWAELCCWCKKPRERLPTTHLRSCAPVTKTTTDSSPVCALFGTYRSSLCLGCRHTRRQPTVACQCYTPMGYCSLAQSQAVAADHKQLGRLQ
jgi:hypothetical protein